MQNFTLGKKGYSLLLFALVLLIGSASSYGQCPTPAGTSAAQEFCFLATVGDIQRDGTDTAVYQTADNANDTQAIPSSELLSDNTTYYVGGQSGTCTRVPVTVDITAEDYPNNTLFPGENSFTISPCSSTFTAEELATYFEAITDYEIKVYEDEFGMTEATGQLTPNESYFVGQVSTDGDASPTPAENNCPSLRVAVGYDPQSTPPPTAETPQTFCDGATVEDLVAQGTSTNTTAIRWYRTENSFQPLPNSTLLIDGATYYATQIINDRNSPFPPCESETRTAVTVTLDPIDLNESIQRFCESIGEGNNFRKPQVQDLQPQGATFFAEEDSTTPLDPSTELIDTEDYFTRDNGSECSQDRVVVDLFPTPNAGSTTSVTVCSNDEAFNLVDEINDSQLGPAQQTGRFSPELSSGSLIFDPADYQPGSYSFRYIVEGNEDCPTDDSRITVVVQAAPNAGENTPLEFCQNEFEVLIQQILTNPEAAQANFASLIGEDVDTNGDFTNNDLETIANNYLIARQANAFPFNAQSTYTVSNDNCSDSSIITLTVNPSPNAGENGSVEVSREDPAFNLFTELEGTPDTGGTWSPGNSDGTFDPATGTSGVYNYVVTNSFDCTDSASVTVTILEECPVVEETTQSFCESISDVDGNNPRRPMLNDLTPSGATWYETADSEEPLPGTTILENGTTYFAGNSNGTCESRTPVLVNIDDSPNAGGTTFLTVCANDEPFDLLDRYNPSVLGAPDAGGTFSPALASGTTIFDPSVDAATQYTYRVESTNSACPNDTSRITVTITQPTNANAGEDVEESFCSNDGVIDLFTLIPEGISTTGIFEGFENGQFDTSANIGENEIIYTVDEEEGCVNPNSATYFVTVFEAPNAGPGADLNYCITDIQEMSQEDALAIFNNLIPNDVTEGGQFSTSINELIAQFSINPIGEFTTTYTVSNENCSDTATYSVTISDTEVAYAGSDVDNLIFCSTGNDVNLNDFLSDDVLQNGYFEELENGAFSPSTSGVGTFNFTFTVDSTSDCVTGSDSAIYTVEVLQGPDAGENGIVTLKTSDEPVNLFAYLNGTPDEGGLWNPGNADGSFDPSQYEEGQFEFFYTVVSENECEASATVTVTITDEEIICPVITDTEQAFCESIGEGNNSRLPRVSDLIPANATWYATADSDVALASNTVLINGEDYFAGNPDGTCPLRGRVVVTLDDSPNAGGTTAITVCASEEPFDLLDRINPSILGAPDAGGTFTPALASGTTIFDPSVDAGRLYIYTVQSTNAACIDDESRITVSIQTPTPVNAGTIANQTVCSNEDLVLLTEYLTGSGATLGGKFSGDGVSTDGTMFDPSIGSNTDGYTITYSVTAGDSPCTTGNATSIFTITVNEPQEADAGGEVSVSYCVAQNENIVLTSILGSGALNTGSFSAPYEDGNFNPSEAGIGVYTINYTVNGDADCAIGTDSASIIITVTDLPDAPVAEASQSFCLIDSPTVGDIEVTGDNVVIYSDAELTNEADATTALVSGMSYYAVSTNDAATCPSDAVMITVTITDPAAPTLQTDGNEFCRADNPTVQELIGNLSGSGIQIYSSNSGGTAISTTTPLENGVTYYATTTAAASDCESSERLAIAVEVTFCGIPEGFSPNGDGINDRFVIPDIATNYPNYTIEIFNRWGNVVFKGNASTPDWDGFSNESGTLGDDVLPVGVYFYILNYNDGQTPPVQGKLYLSI